jgi:hypothetical protein
VAHLARPRGLLGVAGLLEALDPAPAPVVGEVAALGEDQQRVAVAEAAGHRGDRRLGVATARIDEAVGQAVAEHVDERVQAQRLVHDDARPPFIRAQQRVHDQQRVALAGVAAQHDDGRAPGVQRLLGRRGVGRPQLGARHPRHRPDDPRHEPAHHAVVRALHALGVQRATEAARDPQPAARGRAAEVAQRVADRDRHRPQRAQAPDERRQQRGDEGQGRRQHDEQRLDDEDERRDDQAAGELRHGGHLASPSPCSAR